MIVQLPDRWSQSIRKFALMTTTAALAIMATDLCSNADETTNQNQIGARVESNFQRVAWIRSGVEMELLQNGESKGKIEIFQGNTPEDLAVAGIRRLYPDILYTLKPAAEPSAENGHYVHDAETLGDGTVRAKFVLSQPFSKLRQAAELVARTRESQWYEQARAANKGQPVELLVERLPVHSMICELRDAHTGTTLAWALVPMRGKTDQIGVTFEFSRPAWAQYLVAEKKGSLELVPIYRASHMNIAIATQQISGSQDISLEVKNGMKALKMDESGPITLDQIDALAKAVVTEIRQLVAADSHDVYLMLLPPTSLVGSLFEHAGQMSFDDLVRQNPEAKARIAAVLEANGFVKSTGKIKSDAQVEGKTRESILDISGGVEVMFPAGAAVVGAGMQVGNRDRVIDSLYKKTGIQLTEGVTEGGLRPFKIDTYRLASGKSSVQLSQCGMVILGKGHRDDGSYFVGSSVNPTEWSLDGLNHILDETIRFNLVVVDEISAMNRVVEVRHALRSKLESIVKQQMTDLDAFQQATRDVRTAKDALQATMVEIDRCYGRLNGGLDHARELLYPYVRDRHDEGEAGTLNGKYLNEYAPGKRAEIERRIGELKAQLVKDESALKTAIESWEKQKASVLAVEKELSTVAKELLVALDSNVEVAPTDDPVMKRAIENYDNARKVLRMAHEDLVKEVVTSRAVAINTLLDVASNLIQIGGDTHAKARQAAWRDGKLQELQSGLNCWYGWHFGMDKEEANDTKGWFERTHIASATRERDTDAAAVVATDKSEVDVKNRGRAMIQEEWVNASKLLAEIKSRSVTLLASATATESKLSDSYRKVLKETTRH